MYFIGPLPLSGKIKLLRKTTTNKLQPSRDSKKELHKSNVIALFLVRGCLGWGETESIGTSVTYWLIVPTDNR
jgi:hypothetical protein